MRNSNPYLARVIAPVIACWLFISGCGEEKPATETIAKAESTGAVDKNILQILANLKPGQSAILPPTQLFGIEEDKDKLGPRHRDYSNKMLYAPERGAALYAGGSHRTWRSNDVWEYRLSNNSWTRLFDPDGGNHSFLKPALYNVIKAQAKNPNFKPSPKQQQQLEKAKNWWKHHVIMKDGNITTKNGGPIMPAHTWDAFAYDPRAKKFIWGSGASPGSSPLYHWTLTGEEEIEVKIAYDENYSPAWTFEPATLKWERMKKKNPGPKFRGMGASMTYIPDFDETFYYVAAANVKPGAYEMWAYNSEFDQWRQLSPKNGHIRQLAVAGQAPKAEQQMAYVASEKKLYAVRHRDLFAYDLQANEWNHVVKDERIFGHDAKTVFVHDNHNDVLLLANPQSGQQLAAYSIKDKQWQMLTPNGPAIPPESWGKAPYMGYFDPEHKVLVLAVGRNKIWVYRYGEPS